ncbi:ABC transporter ATP-binding protein [Burkholderia cepacia]|uniref:ABC transporter ATP-binding protein n=1 Tax=Burkholderia cepacia TaxID=292 RepID=UPI001F2BDFEA|nr:ABC transporter ATP-binding protein [Burkholderia cepacia]MCE4124418.1 ABC transporter ATP-binding protein [Burkholderia cepacia]
MPTLPLLAIDNLTISYGRNAPSVKNFSLEIAHGEKIGIVGESGSGKSQSVRAIAGVLTNRAKVTATSFRFNGSSLEMMSEKHLRLRGHSISMILQDPHYSLNPVLRVGPQIDEAFRKHHRLRRPEAKAKTLDVLLSLRISDPERVYDLYPHQISGGMGQRIMIAMMLAPNPALLIADEPTSALDESVAESVMNEIRDQVLQRSTSLLLISHDLNLVAKFCERILVMRCGVVVETLRADALHLSRHPYTRALLDCIPRLDSPRKRLPTIPREVGAVR